MIEIFNFPPPINDSIPIDKSLLLHWSNRPEDVFGQNSTMEKTLLYSSVKGRGERDGVPIVATVQQNPYQHSITLALLGLLIVNYWFLLRYMGEIGKLCRVVFSVNRMVDMSDNYSVSFGQFLKYSWVVMLWSIIVAMFYCLYSDGLWRQLIPMPAWLMMTAGLALFLLIWLYRHAVQRLCWVVSGKSEFYNKLTFINKLTRTVTVVFYAPIATVIMFAGVDYIYIMAFGAVMLIYYYFLIYKYFIISGFAHLQCFLYLCTIEILPVSLLWRLTI